MSPLNVDVAELPIAGDRSQSCSRARYYDAAVGRWISEDPIGFAAGDTNVVRYVLNSATNLTDPSGLTPEGPGEAVWGPSGDRASENAYMMDMQPGIYNSEFRDPTITIDGEVYPLPAIPPGAGEVVLITEDLPEISDASPLFIFAIAGVDYGEEVRQDIRGGALRSTRRFVSAARPHRRMSPALSFFGTVFASSLPSIRLGSIWIYPVEHLRQ